MSEKKSKKAKQIVQRPAESGPVLVVGLLMDKMGFDKPSLTPHPADEIYYKIQREAIRL